MDASDNPFQTTVDFLERIVASIGRIAVFFLLFMVLTEFAIVILRYVFNYGSIAYQESVFYMHGFVIMLSTAYTLQKDGHVRVDILYAKASNTTKAWLNLLGSLFFLIPFSAALFYYSLPYALNSIMVLEGSHDVSGLQIVYILKSTIVISSFLLMIQGFAIALKNIIAIRYPSSPVSN